jgi:hypothetical protein
MKTSEMNMSKIFTHIKDKYKNDRDTNVFLLASERASNKIKDLDNVPASAKNLWILVETTKIRTNIRQEIANDFNIRKFHSSSISSIDQIKIDDFIKDTGKYKKIESIRIIFKYPSRFVLSNFKWANMTLEKSVGKLGKPDNIDEVNVLTTINKYIADKGGKVDLRIKGKLFKNVIGFNAGPAKAKADFIIIDENGKEIGYISYKAGSTPGDFQQYSGISEKGYGGEIYNNPEVKRFRERIINEGWDTLSKDNGKSKKSVYIKIKAGTALKNRAVFGKDFRRSKGINNVDFFAQGNPKLDNRGNIVILSFPTKLIENGRVNQLNGEYDPVIAARKGEQSRVITADISDDRGNIFRIKERNVRGGIWAEGHMKARDSKELK